MERINSTPSGAHAPHPWSLFGGTQGRKPQLGCIDIVCVECAGYSGGSCTGNATNFAALGTPRQTLGCVKGKALHIR